MAAESFVVFTEHWSGMALLSREQRGDLLEALMALHGACEMPELDQATAIVLAMIRPRMEANRKKYEETVGRNTNMLLGIVIDDHGRVPEADCRRLAEFADAIRARYGTPLKTVSGKGATVELRLDAPTAIDRAILQEEIAQGERVLAYELEGREGDAWVPLAKGTNIGHKRIATFAPRTLSAVRLRVTRFKAEPRIRALSVFTKQ